MRASRGEIKIEEILKEAGLNFQEEYIFPDLKSPNGRPLRFDFVVFEMTVERDIQQFLFEGNTRKRAGHLNISRTTA